MKGDFKYVGPGGIYVRDQTKAGIIVPEGAYTNLPQEVQDALELKLSHLGDTRTSGEMELDLSAMEFIKAEGLFDYNKTSVISIPGWDVVRSLLKRFPHIDL